MSICLGNDGIKIGTKCTNYGCNEVNMLIFVDCIILVSCRPTPPLLFIMLGLLKDNNLERGIRVYIADCMNDQDGKLTRLVIKFLQIFIGPESNISLCQHHPGVAIFHDG